VISIVIVSHSPKVAQGAKELADEMSQGKIKIFAAGGVDDNTIGTNAERIQQALESAMNDDGVLVLLDMGSAVMSTQMAVEMLPDEDQAKVTLSNAPLIEGAVIASIEAAAGNALAAVNAAAEMTREMEKLD